MLVTEGVDDVADSVEWRNSVLDPAERPPRRTPKAWKAIGVGYSAKGWLAAAERAFTLGLQLDPDHASLRLARSQVRCQMGRARSALDDAETLLARDHSTYSAALLEKALLAAAGAAYGLQLWAVAQDKLEQMLTLGTDSDDAQHVLDEVNARMHEAATGEYDWEALYLASQEEDGEVDVADYTSDALEIEDVGDDRGRGVVVNRDVPAGTLLMVAKPFAAAVVTPGGGESLALTVNLHCREVEGPSADAGLVSDIVARFVPRPPRLLATASLTVPNTPLPLPLPFLLLPPSAGSSMTPLRPTSSTCSVRRGSTRSRRTSRSPTSRPRSSTRRTLALCRPGRSPSTRRASSSSG